MFMPCSKQIFMLEGDNLLLKPISYLAKAYQIEELNVDATITHISFHASFLSLDFVTQLNLQATNFATFTGKWLNECFLTGPGQDMRLGYEGARFLQVARYVQAKADGASRVRDAKILNTAGGTVPCKMKGRRWVSLLEAYCSGRGADLAGPCALEKKLRVFNANNGSMFSENYRFEFMPMLLECEPNALRPPDAAVVVPGSLQLNIKGESVRQIGGDCTTGTVTCLDPMPTDVSEVSKTFFCETKPNGDENHKALTYKNGRVFSMVPNHRGLWVEHFNLHFQGGGCKVDMVPVWATVVRSVEGTRPMDNFGFTCETASTRAEHMECLRSGVGATPSMGEDDSNLVNLRTRIDDWVCEKRGQLGCVAGAERRRRRRRRRLAAGRATGRGRPKLVTAQALNASSSAAAASASAVALAVASAVSSASASLSAASAAAAAAAAAAVAVAKTLAVAPARAPAVEASVGPTRSAATQRRLAALGGLGPWPPVGDQARLLDGLADAHAWSGPAADGGTGGPAGGGGSSNSSANGDGGGNAPAFFFCGQRSACSAVEHALRKYLHWSTVPCDSEADLAFLDHSSAFHHGVDYIKSPLFSGVVSFFERAGVQGRAFTVLRDPVRRIESAFRYLKVHSWSHHFDERRSFDLMERFLSHEATEHDWLVRSLAAALHGTRASNLTPAQQPGRRVHRSSALRSGQDDDYKRDDDDSDALTALKPLLLPMTTNAAELAAELEDARSVLFLKVAYGLVEDLESALRIIFRGLGLRQYVFAASAATTASSRSSSSSGAAAASSSVGPGSSRGDVGRPEPHPHLWSNDPSPLLRPVNPNTSTAAVKAEAAAEAALQAAFERRIVSLNARDVALYAEASDRFRALHARG